MARLPYVKTDGAYKVKYNDQYPVDNFAHNSERMTLEELIDYVDADLTVSGMLPKVLPDLEVKRIITETALGWFYQNHQYALQKQYYRLSQEFIRCDEYTQMGYITLPEEIEDVVRIVELNNPSLFQVGIQAPNLAINFGVTNSPYLTSFVSNIGELGVYRQILSSFSNEINKLARNYTKFNFSPMNKRLMILDEVRTSYMLETYTRIEQEKVFNDNLFKDYVVALSRIRLSELLGRLNFQLPGQFQYNAEGLATQGQTLLDKTIEKIKGISPNNSFFIMGL